MAAIESPIPTPGASLLGAYWLNSPLHAADKCVWCVQLGQAGPGAPRDAVSVGAQTPRRPGGPKAGPVPEGSLASAAERLADSARMVMLSMAVCTVVSAMLVVTLM